MGGKKGGGQRTPHIAPNTLESKQKINLIHLLCAGTISGWQQDSLLKSIRFNDTRVQNSDDSFSFNNVRVNWLAGDLEQDYLVGFDGIERTSSVGAQVTKRTPITRTITDPLVGSLRVTLGVNALFRQTDQGDMYGTHVDLSIQTIKNNQIHSSVIWSLNEKGNTPFKQDATISDLPEAPFDLKIVRLTNDSTSDKLKNDTMFHSYVEVIPQKFSYPTCAVVGIELDAEQLGGQVPIINYEILGREVQVPSNYDPVTRKYTGLWDGSFKSAYTNNIAWIVYDFMTDSVHGLGRYFNQTIIDKMRLYEIGRYADVMVDDGSGGEEPRYVFNGLIQGNDATTILHNLCSVFRGRPVEKNGFISFIYDKGNENPVYTYTNANVIDGVFNYTHAPLDTRINSVQYEYADERDGCKIKVEEISNHKSIAKYNRINTEKITCYGQTRRSAALRHAKWFLETAETETESVDFIVGFQGIKHGAFDIVAIADNNKAGIPIGGRILSTDGNVVTLDREVVGAKEIRIRKDLYTVKDQIGGDKYRLDRVIDAKPYDVFSANTERATERLFKVISTEENEDGSYTISAVKYNAQKQSVVDSSVSQYPEIETSLNPAPVLTDGNIANQGDYLLLTWDSLASVGTEVTYNVQIFKDNKHYQTHTTKDPMLKLYNLPMGEYYAKIKGRTNTGGYSQELIIPFSTTYNIHNLVTKPAVFGFDMSWQNPPLITTNSKVEVWASDDDEAFNKIATLAYPQDAHSVRNLSIGDELYVKVRIVDDMLNYGEFTDSVMGKPSQDADQVLSYLDGKISEKEISKDLQDQFDSNIDDKVEKAKEGIKSELDGIEIDLTGINSEIDNIKSEAITTNSNLENVKENAEKALSDAENNAQAIKEQSTVIDSVSKKQGEVEANWQLAQMSNVSAHKSEFARSMSMSAQVAQNIAKIEEIDSFIVTEKEATATRFTQINTRVDSAESKITSVETSLASDIKAEASKREALEAVFDLSKAQQQLQLMTQATADKSLSSRLFSMSASTANAHAKYDELQEVVATNEDARVTNEQKLQAEIDSSKANITRLDEVMTSEFASQATSISNLSSELDGAKADIKTAEQAIVNNEKSQSKRNEEFNAQFGENEAKHQLSLLTESSNTRSLSQRYFSLSAQTANSSAKIESLEKVFADSEVAWAVTEHHLQSQLDSSKSEISRIDKTVTDNEKSQAQAMSSLSSEINNAKSDIKNVEKAQSDAEKSLTSQINSVNSEWKDASRVKYLTGEVKEKTPAEYLSEYGITTVTEFGSRAWFGISEGTYHTVETVISFNYNLERGRVTQTATSNDFAKSVIRERKSTSDETWSPWIILEDISGSQAKADAAQQEAIKVSKSSINSYATTQAAANKAFTEQINSANSEIGKNKSSITQISSTQATTDGKVNAMYTLKVDAKGNIGGIMLGANEHESMFKVAADTFVVSTPDQSVNMFSLQQVNGKTVAAINGDLIAKGSISGDKITANTSIQAPVIKGGRVESGHIAGGQLNIGNGNCTISQNGDFYAKNGRFEGTVQAGKIEGDVVRVITGNRDTNIIIPPANFRRRLIFSEGFIGGGFLLNKDYIMSRAEVYVNDSFVKRVESTKIGGFYTYTPIAYTRMIAAGETIAVMVKAYNPHPSSTTRDTTLLMPHFILFKD